MGNSGRGLFSPWRHSRAWRASRCSGFCFRITSATTRPPRKGETDGQSYYFLDADEFRARIERGEFIEWAEVHGHLYGTPRAYLEQTQVAGEHLILNIDTQGAMQLKDRGEAGVYIFLLPPDRQSLADRLFKRKTDRPEEVQRRLARADEEVAESHRYDHRVVNDDLDRAVAEIESLIAKELGK